VLTLLEGAYTVEVEEMGWLAPLSDGTRGGDGGLDLYLAPLEPGEAYVQGDGDGPDVGRDAESSFIVLDETLPEDLLPAYVFHEFNHACQYAMDAAEADPFWEMTASYVELLLQPHLGVAAGYYHDFQSWPRDAVDDFSHDDEYSYGSSLFLNFLSQRYFGRSPDMVRDLWLRTAQLSPDYTNEPDWVDALEEMLAPVTWQDALGEFSRWRPFTGAADDGAHFLLPTAMPSDTDMAVAATWVLGSGPTTFPLTVAETGCALVVVEVGDPGPGVTLVASVANAPRGNQVELSLLSVAADKSVARQAVARGMPAEVALWPLTGIVAVKAVVAMLGDGRHDPEDQEWAGRTVGLTLATVQADAGPAAVDAGPAAEDASVAVDAATAAGPGDAGTVPPPTGGDDNARSCQAGAVDGAGWPWGAVALLAALGARRRRREP
jgi:MYXO-CTERM domain-containing protein